MLTVEYLLNEICKSVGTGSNGLDYFDVLLKKISCKEIDLTNCLDSIFINKLNVSIRQKLDSDFESHLSFYCNSLLLKWTKLKTKNDKPNDQRNQIIEKLHVLNLLRFSELYSHVFLQVINTHIDKYTHKLLHSSYESTYLSTVQLWCNQVIIPFMYHLMGNHTQLSSIEKSIITYISTSISCIRTSELFEIITEYPDSKIALKELKDTSSNQIQQTYIGKSFRQLICKRLLHAGASTTQILDMYITIVRVFRYIDSSDVLLNYVALPIRYYLKQRKDTVYCIVSSLAQGKESDLHNELKKGELLEYGQDEDYEEPLCSEHWVPRTRNTEFHEMTMSGMDILALLVSIYGSTQIFVHEYKSLLCRKLLSSTQYEIDHELITLEHLKKRFGDDSLHSCEVMLYDIQESKRTNTAIQSHIQSKYPSTSTSMSLSCTHPSARIAASSRLPIEMMIISDTYWPSTIDHLTITPSTTTNTINTASTTTNTEQHIYIEIDNDEDEEDTAGYTLHPILNTYLEQYMKAYSDLKKPRKLDIYPLLGQVELSLEFQNNITRTFTVSPLQATLIQYFDDNHHKEISLNTLSDIVGLEPTIIRQKIQYWIQVGVLQEMIHTNSNYNNDVLQAELNDLNNNNNNNNNNVITDNGITGITYRVIETQSYQEEVEEEGGGDDNMSV